MSSVIEYRHLAVALSAAQAFDGVRRQWPEAPALPWGYDGDVYFVFTEHGDSNVFDQNNRRSRGWELTAMGPYDEVLTAATRVAAQYVIGGCVKLRTNTRNTTPENYIATYRRALDTARTFAELEAIRPGDQVAIAVTDQNEFLAPWDGQRGYKKRLIEQGVLTGQSPRRVLTTRPLGTDEARADFLWLATRANPLMETARLAPEQRRAWHTWLDALSASSPNRRRA